MKETPMMKQYMGFKRQYPDKVVLFRMGDFYETFGDDAKIVSKALNITLTTRDKNTDPTPLAGFPYHALDNYLPKLVSAEINAVVVEQIEDPKEAKGVVKRGVTRIVTPGTLDGDLAKDDKNPYLLSLYLSDRRLGVAYCDLSTGELFIGETESDRGDLEQIVNSTDPVEILVADQGEKIDLDDLPVQVIELESKKVESHQDKINQFYGSSSLDALGLDRFKTGIIALSMLLTYIEETQKMIPDHIMRPKVITFDNRMPLDTSTIRNLDLVQNSYTGERKDSLIETLDSTQTPMGRRKIYNWVLNPLLVKDQIDERLDVVEILFKDGEFLEKITSLLSEISDVDRILGKVGLNRANARDLKSLQNSLENILVLFEMIESKNELSKKLLHKAPDWKDIQISINEVIEIIESNIVDDPPNGITEGGIIKKGVDDDIDSVKSIAEDSKGWLKNLEREEREKYEIPSLKVSFNKVFGYYIEVTKTHQDKVPDNYIRKQTLVNSERYITDELKEKEEIILNSSDKLSKMEYEHFQKLRTNLLNFINDIRSASEMISKLDVLSGFANNARYHEYVRPKIYGIGDNEGVINIKGGRHPVVEKITEEKFISNDTFMSDSKERMIIITGPNMSGKSTYIRQVALVVLMAQIGSFVPAKEAEISIVDKIFSRVGASDNLSQGRSTFMVEMEEAANIVNNATQHSLIVLDEVGRGTSTYDGVSIAWALVEYLVNTTGSRTLFATHYHELTSLEEENPDLVKNYNVGVKEKGDEVIFLRSIKEGGTDKSYGIYVAQMAGIPEQVIDRANSIMKRLEIDLSNGEGIKSKTPRKVEKAELQFALFPESVINDEILKELKNLEVNSISPMEALQILQKLKEIQESEEDK